VPMWWSANPSKLARAMLPRLLDLQGEPQPYRMDLDDMASVARTMPDTLGEMMAQVKAQVNLKLDLTARIAWAKFVSAYGFSTPPGPRPTPEVTPETRVRVRHPVVAIALGNANAIIACVQHVLTHCAPLASVAGELRVGSEHAVGDLARLLPPDDADAGQQMRRMLRDLASFRALEIVS
jgi:hypothetical protein